MRSHMVILLTLGVIAQVSASKTAGPWQIVAFFYAYRISINAFGVDKNPIASNIRGSIADGSCTLDEFVELTRKPNKNKIPFPKGLIGDDLTPDPLATVLKIKNSAYDARQKFDTTTLLPGHFERESGHPLAFADQIAQLSNHVAIARISMAGEIGSSQALLDTELNFANLKAAVRGTLDARRSDFNKNTISQLIESLRLHGIAPVIRTVTAMDSTDYLELDTALTINGSTSPAIDAEIVVNRAVARMGPLSEDGNIRRHAAVISMLEEWLDDLDAPC